VTAHIKVAQVVPSFYPAFHYGGPTQSTYALCRAVAQQGCTVRVLTTNANGLRETLDVPTDREVEVDGLHVRYCRRVARHTISPALLAQLREYVRWADVVHLMGVYNFTTFPTLVACRLYGKPLVWSPRGALQRWSGSRRPLLKQLWESAAKVVAPRRLALHVTSERELQQSQARIPAKIARVIPNAVEVPNQVQHTPRGDTLRLLFLGRLDPIKGIENLLEACRQLSGW
jgi:glycosyltransferase involved in cell wall biosynthesis